jgi:hypothetical protein
MNILDADIAIFIILKQVQIDKGTLRTGAFAGGGSAFIDRS